MKGFAAMALAALLMALSAVPCALAQQSMRIYVSEGAMSAGQTQQMRALLEREWPDRQWQLIAGDQTLAELVLADCAPDLAVCPPGEARPWAAEGLLQPLQLRVPQQARMQTQVLQSCVLDEALFMAPLFARHRQMAVNRRLFDRMGLGYMLDRQAYPVWLPAQFYQIMEEFLLHEETALDIWRAQSETSAAIEALTQSIFGGMLLDGEDARCTAGDMDMRGGVRWLRDAVDDEMIGYCLTREDALSRFMQGETAIFIDWTEAEAERQRAQMEETGMSIVTMPYPSASGMPVRSFEVTGVCAFDSGDASRSALALEAAALLGEKAQEIAPGRGIWTDNAVWLWDLGAHEKGATLRSLFCRALVQVLEGDADAGEALLHVQAAMDAMR